MKEYKEKNVCYNTAYNLGKSFEYNKWISEIKEMIKVIHKKEHEEMKELNKKIIAETNLVEEYSEYNKNKTYYNSLED